MIFFLAHKIISIWLLNLLWQGWSIVQCKTHICSPLIWILYGIHMVRDFGSEVENMISYKFSKKKHLNGMIKIHYNKLSLNLAISWERHICDIFYNIMTSNNFNLTGLLALFACENRSKLVYSCTVLCLSFHICLVGKTNFFFFLFLQDLGPNSTQALRKEVTR